jgi:hypothetical protein
MREADGMDHYLREAFEACRWYEVRRLTRIPIAL